VNNRITFLRKALYSLVVVCCFFSGAEIFLRLSGFHYQRGLSYMEFGYPNPSELHQVFEPDQKLLFRMKPGYDFKLGFGPLNQQGFRGQNFEMQKPSGVFRIVCLGDSVTFGTAEGSYPEMLSEILSEKFPEMKIQVYNFGVPGYSSWQGKNLLERVIKDYHPDLVIVFYGWNDHWLARGFSDSEQRIPEQGLLIMLRDILSRLRIYQFMNKLIADVGGKFLRMESWKFRVPIEEYRRLLKEMIEMVNSNGSKIILATSPAGFGLGELPDFLEALQFVRDASKLESVHNQYNQVVRELAQDSGTDIVDLDLIFQEEGVKNFFDNPQKDIIHPNEQGLKLIAKSFAQKIMLMLPELGEVRRKDNE